MTSQCEHDKLEYQRLFDLVRIQRGELHEAGLISDSEYASLAEGHGSVSRLESYDKAIQTARVDALEEAAQVICPFCKETKTSAFFALPAVNGTHEIRTTLDNQPAGWNKPCRAAAIRALKGE